MIGEGQCVGLPFRTCRHIFKHRGQGLVQCLLRKRTADDTTGVRIDDVVGIPTDARGQYRQPGHQGFKQDGAGVFVVGGVNQEVRAEQKTRDVIATGKNLHPVPQPKPCSLQPKRPRIVLPDGDQARAVFQVLGERRERPQTAVEPLGLEAGADLQQQQIIRRQPELPAECGTDLIGIRRGAAIRIDARRQRMESFRRCPVMADEQGLLRRRDRQDLGMAGRGEHGPFVCGKVSIAGAEPVQGIAQRARLFLETGIGGVIHIETRHLVEADDSVRRPPCEVGLHPFGKFGVAAMVCKRTGRHADDLKALGNVAAPFERVDANAVPARLTGERDAQEIALEPAEGEILVETECELHRGVLRAGQQGFKSLPDALG